MKLTLLTTLTATAGALVMTACDPATSHPSALDTPAEVKLPVAVAVDVVCLDGWEALKLPGGSVLYRHQHDVAEHLISCQES